MASVRAYCDHHSWLDMQPCREPSDTNLFLVMEAFIVVLQSGGADCSLSRIGVILVYNVASHILLPE